LPAPGDGLIQGGSTGLIDHLLLTAFPAFQAIGTRQHFQCPFPKFLGQRFGFFQIFQCFALVIGLCFGCGYRGFTRFFGGTAATHKSAHGVRPWRAFLLKK